MKKKAGIWIWILSAVFLAMSWEFGYYAKTNSTYSICSFIVGIISFKALLKWHRIYMKLSEDNPKNN